MSELLTHNSIEKVTVSFTLHGSYITYTDWRWRF